MYLLIVIVIIFLSLVASEYLWKRKLISPEASRKLVHISSGVMVAFLPFFTPYKYIAILAIVFLATLFLSSKFKIFKSIKQVKRRTLGEYMFALVILICAIIAPPHYVFMIAMLNLALADGMAAVIGEKFGKNNRYKIFNNRKSIAGSATFLFVSFGILAVSIIQGGIDFNYSLILLPIILLFSENIFIQGIDNLMIPIIVVVFLTNI